MSVITPKTIATFTTDPYGTVGVAPQRQVWFANGRWWVSYSDYEYSYYDSTADSGVTWKGATVISDFTPYQARAYKDSIWWDEESGYVYYTRCGDQNMEDITWQRGTCGSNGMITWGAAVAVGSNLSAVYRSYPATCKDTNGYPWASFIYYPSNKYLPAAAKASATNGSTWNAGVTVDSAIVVGVGLTPLILPLASGRMICIYPSGANLFFKTYNGTSWDATSTTITTTFSGYFFAANNGNTVYILYGGSNGDIKLRKYVYGVGLSAEETVIVTPTPNNYNLTITYDSTSDICYIFYTTDGRYLNMTTRASDGSYGPLYRLFDEGSDVSISSLTSSFNVQNTSEIIVCYQKGSGNPWTLRAAILSIPLPILIPVATIDAVSPRRANVSENVSFIGHGESSYVPTPQNPVIYAWSGNNQLMSTSTSFTYPASSLAIGCTIVNFWVTHYGESSLPVPVNIKITDLPVLINIQSSLYKTGIRLQWEYSSGSEYVKYIHVYRKLNEDYYELIDTLNGSVVEWVDNDRTADDTYYYALVAENHTNLFTDPIYTDTAATKIDPQIELAGRGGMYGVRHAIYSAHNDTEADRNSITVNLWKGDMTDASDLQSLEDVDLVLGGDNTIETKSIHPFNNEEYICGSEAALWKEVHSEQSKSDKLTSAKIELWNGR